MFCFRTRHKRPKRGQDSRGSPLRFNDEPKGRHAHWLQIDCIAHAFEKRKGGPKHSLGAGHLHEALQWWFPFRNRQVSVSERDDQTGLAQIPWFTNACHGETDGVALVVRVDDRLAERDEDQRGVRYA